MDIFDYMDVFLAIELYNFLYVLDINSLSDVWLANIFSHSVDYHLFDRADLFSLM